MIYNIGCELDHQESAAPRGAVLLGDNRIYKGNPKKIIQAPRRTH